MNLIQQETCPLPDYRLIPLTQGQFAKVSVEDYENLSQWKWFAEFSKCTRTFYARRNIRTGIKQQRRIGMHRVVLGFICNDGKRGDHINGDTLDNRRQNLRPATPAQNVQNSCKRRTNTSGYTGVQFHPKTGKWTAKVTKDYTIHYLGLFKTKEQAADARRIAVLRLHGEFARI